MTRDDLISAMKSAVNAPTKSHELNWALQAAETYALTTAVGQLTKYAWWKDGVQYVGSGNKTLTESIKELYD